MKFFIINQEDKKLMIAIINISTYKGITANAEHYYGTLTLMTPDEGDPIKLSQIGGLRDFSGKKYDISRTLDDAERQYLSEKDGMVYFEEDKTLRFNSIDDVYKAGIELYHRLNLDCQLITLFNRKRFKNTVIVEFFTKYMLTNDDGMELLFLTEKAIQDKTPEELYEKYCAKYFKECCRIGLKYVECYKEHLLAKYKIGDIIPKNSIWHDMIVNCIYIKDNKVYYRVRPSYVEGHYSTVTEEKLL